MTNAKPTIEETTTGLVRCPELRLWWFSEYGPAKCTETGHDHPHHLVRRHLHRSRLMLPDGTVVVPVSLDPVDPYARAEPPDYGLYLDELWQPAWEHDHLAWPDMGVPSDAGDARRAFGGLRDRARSGELVEVGCLGGHGRTGTALASLAILGGFPAETAASWVRANYCEFAVETPAQEEFVLGFEA